MRECSVLTPLPSCVNSGKPLEIPPRAGVSLPLPTRFRCVLRRVGANEANFELTTFPRVYHACANVVYHFYSVAAGTAARLWKRHRGNGFPPSKRSCSRLKRRPEWAVGISTASFLTGTATGTTTWAGTRVRRLLFGCFSPLFPNSF